MEVLIAVARLGIPGGLQTAEPVAANFSQSDVILLIVYVMMALGFSFLCSVAEAVLLSVTPSYIAGLRKKQPAKAERLYRLKMTNVDRALAAILTLNTIAHTVGAIGSGAKATKVFGSAWFGLFSAVVTLLILFLSEIIPKTLGATYWRPLAPLTANFVQLLIFLLYPLIWVSEKLTRLIGRGHTVTNFNREEFVALAGIGEKQGDLNIRESHIINNLFKLKAIRAKDIMTPRTVMVALQKDLNVEEALAKERKAVFSRLPLYGRNIDDIDSIILRDDLLLAHAQQKNEMKLHELGRPIQAVEAAMPLNELLEFLLNHRQKLVLVVDEYGGTIGLVTMEDVIETLLGMEIVDETDRVEDMQALAREKWAQRAKAFGLEVGKLQIEPDKKESAKDKKKG